MNSFSYYYKAFTLIITTCGFVGAILNDKALTDEEARDSIYLEGQAHPVEHDKVSSTTAVPPGACECMGYWECVANNGHVYTYCGINDNEVCCFYKRKIKGSVIKEEHNNNNINNLAKSTTAELVTTITTLAPPTTTSYQFYSTGNEFIISPNVSYASTLPDVDYFYSLEDDVGDLKQITSTESSVEVITRTTSNLKLGRPSCGIQAVDWKLDSKAEFSEWPWHVALLEGHEDVYVCGGTLISNDKVITAAHCVHPYIRRRNTSKLKVRAGEYDISTNDEKYPFVEVPIERIFMHPNFNNATLVNDIALIKLLHPLNYTENIIPVCLSDDRASSRFPPYCVVTGWGRESETSPFSIVLKEVVVPLWTHEDCEDKLQKNFGTLYELPETSICAGELGHDACDVNSHISEGDGGGGLVCYDARVQRFYLKGITSFGIGCGRVDSPGVYVNLEFYISWIESFA